VIFPVIYLILWKMTTWISKKNKWFLIEFLTQSYASDLVQRSEFIIDNLG
jgi:hypothetical protein